jgi:hypothetical protein
MTRSRDSPRRQDGPASRFGNTAEAISGVHVLAAERVPRRRQHDDHDDEHKPLGHPARPRRRTGQPLSPRSPRRPRRSTAPESPPRRCRPPRAAPPVQQLPGSEHDRTLAAVTTCNHRPPAASAHRRRYGVKAQRVDAESRPRRMVVRCWNGTIHVSEAFDMHGRVGRLPRRQRRTGRSLCRRRSAPACIGVPVNHGCRSCPGAWLTCMSRGV